MIPARNATEKDGLTILSAARAEGAGSDTANALPAMPHR